MTLYPTKVELSDGGGTVPAQQHYKTEVRVVPWQQLEETHHE